MEATHLPREILKVSPVAPSEPPNWSPSQAPPLGPAPPPTYKAPPALWTLQAVFTTQPRILCPQSPQPHSRPWRIPSTLTRGLASRSCKRCEGSASRRCPRTRRAPLLRSRSMAAPAATTAPARPPRPRLHPEPASWGDRALRLRVTPAPPATAPAPTASPAPRPRLRPAASLGRALRVRLRPQAWDWSTPQARHRPLSRL